MTKLMVMEHTLIIMEQSMKVTGKMISSTVGAKKLGQMEHIMKGIMKMGKNTGRVSFNLQMAHHTKEILT